MWLPPLSHFHPSQCTGGPLPKPPTPLWKAHHEDLGPLLVQPAGSLGVGVGEGWGWENLSWITQ